MSHELFSLPPPRKQKAGRKPIIQEWEDEDGNYLHPIRFFPADLPDLDWTADGFNWSKEELREACTQAREWLYPI